MKIKMKMNFQIAIGVLVATTMLGGPLYAKGDKDKPLPPGLQMNVDRGKPLPPGWQKKLEKGQVLDTDVYRHARIVTPVDKTGIETVEVEGRRIRLMKATRRIVDILRRE
jgi:hypothetical protein